jgi:hypothetical protein
MVVANNKINGKKIHVKRWGIHFPCGYSGAMQGASPNGEHSWLHAKQLDAKVSVLGGVG